MMNNPSEPLDPVQLAYQRQYWISRAIMLGVLLLIGLILWLCL